MLAPVGVTLSSGLAPALKEWRADVKAGGARRDLAFSKAMVGSAAGALAVELASKGLITGGGPADDNAKRLMEADGWQPYSLKLGNQYVSYQRLDPFSSTLGIAADMVDQQSHMTDKQREDTATLLVTSALQNMSNKTWLSGLSSAFQALSDPGRYADNWISRTVGSIAVPSVVAQAARTIDPLERNPKGVLERVESRIPFLSKNIEPRRDVFGQPIKQEGSIGPDFISPIYGGAAKNDPTIAALIDANAKVTAPQHAIGGVPLDAATYGRYAETIGNIAKPQLDRLVASPGWRSATNDDRDDAVDKIMKQARKVAKQGINIGGPVLPAASQGLPPGYVLDAAPDLPPGYVLER